MWQCRAPCGATECTAVTCTAGDGSTGACGNAECTAAGMGIQSSTAECTARDGGTETCRAGQGIMTGGAALRAHLLGEMVKHDRASPGSDATASHTHTHATARTR